MANKENDWFLAVSENPDFQVSNFMQVGLTTDNTQLKDKSFYQNSQYIQELYQKDGKFDQASFDAAYNKAASMFQDFSNNSFKDQLLSDYQYDPYNSTRPLGASIKEPNISINKVANPLRQVIGFGGIGSMSAPTITIEEAAQKSKIFDWAKQEFTDFSPNDNALENSVVGYIESLASPLVLAQWDDDGTHIDPMTNRKVSHKKGDLKTNNDGDFYYETLGGRSAYGRQVKSVFDTITVDGSALNKYDFFDSDGLDKSVTGTIAKATVAIAPLFTPLAPYYGYAMIGAQLMDLLPTMYNTIAGNFTDSTIPFLNNVQGIGRSFRGNTSQYSKEHTMTFENFANTIVDVALQWQQQRTLFDLYHKAAGTDKLIKTVEAETSALTPKTFGDDVAEQLGAQVKSAQALVAQNKLKPLLDARNKMAANASLGYMSALQAFDTYEDALEQEATKTEAAAMAWGAALGMFVVDKSGLGELFFPELESDAKAYRNAIGKLRDELSKGYSTISATEKGTRKGLFKLMDKARNASSKYWQGVKEHSLGFIGKTLSEGIEEVSEELVTDFVKSTFNLMTDLGLTSSGKKMDAWENGLSRYAMNFFGGAVGGAVFYGVDLVQGRKSKQETQELMYLLRNGKKQELLDTVQELQKQGKLGSTTLSGTQYSQDESDNISWLTATDEKDSQNNLIGKQLIDVVETFDKALHQEELDFSDPEIIDRIVMSDLRLLKLMSVVGETGTSSRILRDFNNLATQITQKLADIKAYDSQFTDEVRSPTRGDDSEHQEYLNGREKLTKELEELRKVRQDFFSETASANFLDRLLFEIDDQVNKPFYTATFDQYIEARTGKNQSELTVEQIAALRESYIRFKEATVYDQFDTAYEVFKYFNKKYTNTVNKTGATYREFTKAKDYLWGTLVDLQATAIKLYLAKEASLSDIEAFFLNDKTLNPILKSEYDPVKQLPNPEGLTEEELAIKTEEAEQKYIEDVLHKYEKINEAIEKFKEIGFIDTQSRRLLMLAIGPDTFAKDAQELISQLSDIRKIVGHVDSLEDYYTEDGELDIDHDHYDIILKNVDLQKLINLFSDVTPSNLDDKLQELRNIQAEFNSYLDQRSLLLTNPEKYASDNNYNTKYDVIHSIETAEDLERERLIVTNVFKRLFKLLNKYNIDQYNTRQKLINELTEIRENPVVKFLQEVHTEVSGKQSTVIDILNNLNNKLEESNFDKFDLDNVQLQEIDEALQALQITRSLIIAASNAKTSVHNLFGHNGIYNDFIKQFSGLEEYGLIDEDLTPSMHEDLNHLESQLNFLKRIATLNRANTLNEQRKTGQNLNRLLFRLFTCHGDYEPLKEIAVAGINLFDGIEDVDTTVLEKLANGEETEELGQTEIDQLVNRINANYEKMCKTSGLSIPEVNKQLVDQIVSKLTIDKLVTGDTQSIDSSTKSLSALDAAVQILAAASLSRYEFTVDYKDVLASSELIPVPTQENIIFLATAFAKNSTLFDEFVSQVGISTNELHKFFIINGVGGAGKTTILSVVNKLSKKYLRGSSTIALAPKTTQVSQLSGVINADSQYTIDEFLKAILSDEDYNHYKNFLESDVKKNELFEVTDKQKIQILKPIVFKNVPDIRSLFIDECTHLDGLAAAILSEAARQKGFIIYASGDNWQKSYYDVKTRRVINNVNKEAVFAIRTPKLNVSMRLQTVQKKDNSDILTVIASLADVDYSKVALTEIQQKLKDLLEVKSLTYYEGDDVPLCGEKLVTTLDERHIRKILAQNDNDGNPAKLIYVYDKNTANKALIDRLKTEFSSQITLLKADEIQGLEADYTIVDVDFSAYDMSKDQDFFNAVSSLYTMLTRSKVGSLVMDNGISEKFSELKFVPTDYIAFTPNFKDSLQELTDKRLELLQQTIDAGPIAAPVGPAPKPIIKPSGNKKEDIVEAILKTQQLIDTSQLKNSEKDDFRNRVNTISEENEKDDADYDELANQLDNIKNEIQTLETENNNIVTKLTDLKTRLLIVGNYLNNDKFLQSLGDSEDFKSLYNDHLTKLNAAITEYNDVSEIEDFVNLMETKWNDYQEEEYGKEDDDIINDDDDPLPPVEPDPKPGTMTNEIRIWGFYNRIGNENEDYIMIESLYKEEDETLRKLYSQKLYSKIKAAFNYHTDITTLRNILSEILADESDTNVKNFIQSIIDSLSDGDQHYKLVVTKFKDGQDQPATNIPGYSPQTYTGRIVYEFEHEGITKRITIGALTDPDNWMRNVKPGDETRARSYQKYMQKIYEEVQRTGEVSFPVKYNSNQFTNIQKVTPYSFADFEDINPGTMVSPVYISGRYDLNTSVSNTTKGKPVVFVTNSTHYTDSRGRLIELEPTILAQAYADLKSGRAKGALIRKVVLNTSGQFVTNPIPNFPDGLTKEQKREWLEEHASEFRIGLFDNVDIEEDVDYGDYMKTRTSVNTGVRMFVALWNWRAELKGLLNNINDSSTTFSPNKWIIYDPSLSRTEVIIDRSGACKFRTKEMIQSWYNFLDVTIDFITKGLNFAPETAGIDPETAIKRISSLQDFFEAGFNTPFGVKTIDRSGEVNIIKILSRIYRYVQHDTNYDTEFSELFPEIKFEQLAFGGSNVSALDEWIAEWKNDLRKIPNGTSRSQPIEAFDDMFNIIFHGRRFPHRESDENRMSGAMFPDGVFFHPKILKISDSEFEKKDYYPISEFNNESQFVIDVVIQSTNGTIELDMETETVVEIPKSKFTEGDVISTVCDQLGISESSEFVPFIQQAYAQAMDARLDNYNDHVFNKWRGLPKEEMQRRLTEDKLDGLMSDPTHRNPDRHFLFVFRHNLSQILKEHFDILLKECNFNTPTEIDIITDYGKIEIITRNTLRDIHGEGTLNVNGLQIKFSNEEDNITEKLSVGRFVDKSFGGIYHDLVKITLENVIPTTDSTPLIRRISEFVNRVSNLGLISSDFQILIKPQNIDLDNVNHLELLNNEMEALAAKIFEANRLDKNEQTELMEECAEIMVQIMQSCGI